MNDGFILIHRKLLNWEWYSNTNDTRVWIHCLLKANWDDCWFEGIKIKRGSFVTSLQKMSSETKLTQRQIRTSLEHLKTTNNLTIESNHQFSIITINNYDKYQLSTYVTTNDRQTKDKRPTNERQTTDNNIINNNKEQLITINNNKDNIYTISELENEFEDVWEIYPRKRGKTNAKKSYIKARKNGVTKETIEQGIKNYIKYITLNKIEMQYVMHGSTWFNQECWNDDYEKERITKSEKKENEFLKTMEEFYNGTITIE